MIQEIYPHALDNSYRDQLPQPTSRCFVCSPQGVLLNSENGQISLPCYAQLAQLSGVPCYLFSLDNEPLFLLMAGADFSLPGFDFQLPRRLRRCQPQYMVFAAITAWHLYSWYSCHRYCGGCGNKLQHSHIERRLDCPSCGQKYYPTICPAVIIALYHGDRLLLTKYKDRPYTGYALLAGFNEIGETAEQTVAREVMEEVGLRVKNIRYYKSQPWGIDGNLQLGYFAELDGDDSIDMDESELMQAAWYKKDDVDISLDQFSLTNEMICHFFASH